MDLMTTYPQRVTSPALGARRLGRFVLEDMVADSPDSAYWRGFDEVLHRQVGIRLVPLDHPRAEVIRQAAVRAAGITDREVIQVYDVVEFDHLLGIVSEWVNGETLADRLIAARAVGSGAPLSHFDTARIAASLAHNLGQLHTSGVAHGRLNSRSIVLDEERGSLRARIRGHEVESAIYGTAPDVDPQRFDLHGMGAIICACLTGQWPESGLGRAESAMNPGVPTMGRLGGKPALPGQLVADVPAEFDHIVSRCLIGANTDEGPYANMGELEAALILLRDRLVADSAAHTRSGIGRRALQRMPMAIALVLALSGIGALALAINGQRSGESAQEVVVIDSEPLLVSGPSAGMREAPLPVISVRDVDPFGDGQENPSEAQRSMTSKGWVTEQYYSSQLDGKPGVGLVYDLGLARPITSVSFKLLGENSDVEVRTSDKRNVTLSEYELFGRAVGAPERLTMRAPRPVMARYVLVWFTQVPQVEDRYQGGLRQVTIQSG